MSKSWEKTKSHTLTGLTIIKFYIISGITIKKFHTIARLTGIKSHIIGITILACLWTKVTNSNCQSNFGFISQDFVLCLFECKTMRVTHTVQRFSDINWRQLRSRETFTSAACLLASAGCWGMRWLWSQTEAGLQKFEFPIEPTNLEKVNVFSYFGGKWNSKVWQCSCTQWEQFGVPENTQHLLVEFVSYEQFCVLSSVWHFSLSFQKVFKLSYWCPEKKVWKCPMSKKERKKVTNMSNTMHHGRGGETFSGKSKQS